MTSGGNKNRTKYVSVLLQASAMYGNDSGSFALFDSKKYNGKDLLFKDSTIKLVETSETYEALIGDDYMTDLEALNDCPATKAPSTTVPVISKSKDNKSYFLASVLFSLVALVLSGIA